MLCPRATPLNANGRISICYSNTRALPAQRVRCVLGMFSSSEVKVLRPT